MNERNCEKILSLLDAYADGEGTTEERRSVDAHLSSCESCRAALERIRDEKAAVAASLPRAPESLSASVMAQIRPMAAKAKKERRRLVLMRYGSMAACFLLVAAAALYAMSPFALFRNVTFGSNEYGGIVNDKGTAGEPSYPNGSPAEEGMHEQNSYATNPALPNEEDQAMQDAPDKASGLFAAPSPDKTKSLISSLDPFNIYRSTPHFFIVKKSAALRLMPDIETHYVSVTDEEKAAEARAAMELLLPAEQEDVLFLIIAD